MIHTNLNGHAYLIMAYDNFEQLIKLVNALDNERNSIFIHIDKKAQDFNMEIKKNDFK